VHLIDGGTGGMFLVHALARLAAAVIVDAADFGGMAGEYRIVSARKLWLRRHPPVSVKSFSGFSVHEWDLLKTIELSIMMHELPHPFYIMIIQPRSIAPRSGLSSVLQVRLPHYEKVLCRLLTSLLAGPCGHRNDG
jgi:hydrogenase maturation protease